MFFNILCFSFYKHIRPHYPDSTISRPICEVKQGQVWLVLAWGTSWEVQMLYIFCTFASFFARRPVPSLQSLSPKCRVLTVLLIDLRLETGDWIGAYVRGVLPREVPKAKS